MISPSDAGGRITTPTGGARTGGVMLGGGVPTMTVSERTLAPARSVITAVPGVPAAIVSVAVSEPAGMTTVPTTRATPSFVLVTVTGVSWVAGVENSGTVNVCWRPASLMTCPAEGGRRIARPTGELARGGRLFGGGGPPVTGSPRASAPARSGSRATPDV